MRYDVGRFRRPMRRSTEGQLASLVSLGDGSTLTLDFTTGQLDPRLTFTRASNATFINSSGLVQYADHNLATNTVFANTGGITPTGWTLGTGTGTSGSNGTFVDGNEEWSQTATSGQRPYLTQTITIQAGLAYTCSVYVASVPSGTEARNIIWPLITAGSSQYYQDGVAITSATVITPGRISVVFTQSSGSGVNFRVGLGCTNGNTVGTAVFSRPMLIKGDDVSKPYIASTTGPYQAPRFDHDPSTLAPKGLLIEGSANNLWTYSQDQSQWATSNVTVNTGTQATAPDGFSSLFPVLTNTTSLSQYFVRQRSADTITATSGQVYTYSMFVKKGTHRYVQMFASATTIFLSPAQANFDLDDGTTGNVTNCTTSAVSYGNGWWRLSITVTASASASQSQPFVLYLVSSKTAARSETHSLTSASVYVWGAQVETGSGASSYIPTGASTATRNADECSMTGTNFSSWFNATEGAFLAHARRMRTTDVGRIASANDNTANESIDIGASTTGQFIVTDGGSALATITPGTVTANTAFKIAGAFKLNDVQAALGGTLGTADTGVTMPTVNQLMIGRQAGGSPVYLNGTVSLLKFWPARLPDAQLQSLTT